MAASDVYRSSSIITPGQPVTPGDGIMVACSSPGTLRLRLQDGSVTDAYALQGTAIFDNLAVIDVVAAQTTATATVSVLRKG